ncbi:hypothetical protein CLAFUW4_13616 [Fulvia fulva]|uniref:CHRD domain-containing protein n=1 Tax=Passalora fulva TaxID=5499 RepID=A0A9Q8UVS5_PASFU|nr:uncharacterized protein CLAFUR5_13468 [Fulvia fulva]KAK4610258.1 hypothetical protein CLAFUR4_13619 [Fulvia fulva]KAK4611253.1 hypothetical protein CLAFUR0_13623 [Fulvia fulva]UJO24220.1 hypothetical protein CLAFUR5_13468 [Fulvia fulva]WPV21902.1 hypothetical protein CLAFUW4_13616 [Fulvia fulva]WPV37090.1 hypothetical protein CLAFUW7_13624 [Fulvia fulva]
MKASVVALSLFAAVGLAAPEAHYGKWSDKNKWSDNGVKWDGEKYDQFTSVFKVKATPDQVRNGTTPTGGQEGACGYYELALNSKKNFICYKIRLSNFGNANYSSPADTATHIHEAARGASGPPRIAFPNPAYEGKSEDRLSIGCLSAPFQTGVNISGIDTGFGFHVKQIEANPAGFFADVHTDKAVPGAVRGQLA